VTGDQITQINLSERKGGKVFYEVARRMPERKFVGVIGSWGSQETAAAALPNVEIVEHTDDILSVYAQTRILMFPSLYEPHPRTPLEACASGIPTIANPVPGTVEALGDAGIYHDADDPDAWVAEIRRLDDEDAYREASMAALRRVGEKDPVPELEAFEQAVLDTVAAYRSSRG
jgi:glycosyltransferase involved in cell wall biosynthesis